MPPIMERKMINLTETSFEHDFAYIAWKPETMTTIHHVINRLRSQFNLKAIDIFVDRCWLPPSEPTHLIHGTDCIVVVEKKESDVLRNGIVDNDVIVTKIKPKKTCKKIVDDDLSSKTFAPEPDVDLEPTKIDETSIDEVEQPELDVVEEAMDVTDDCLAPRAPRRKRRRKHKKKTPLDEEVKTNVVYDQKATEERPVVSENGHQNTSHIRFQENEEEVPQDTTEQQLSDWQENLLNMAQQGGKRVFTRSEVDGKRAVNGDTAHTQSAAPNSPKFEALNETERVLRESVLPLDWEKCPKLLDAKANDLIYFKRLTMIDYSPTASDYILALIEDVIDKQVTLKILKGQQEDIFAIEEILDAEEGNFIVKINWEEMIEPRLVTDRSLLSAYL